MPNLKPGTKLGGWTTTEFIDQGGNGEVWRVSSSDVPLAALKLLKKNNIESVAYRRFRREIAALQRLDGTSGVLPILEANLPEPAKGNRAWYVMPLATSITDELKGQNVSQVVATVHEIAGTLADLHAQGIYHRDIKPGNLLWLDGRPQVADFGLVSLPDATSIAEPGRVPGSLGYMSDEMLADPDTADPAAADVFALAKVLWKLLVVDALFPPQGPLRADGGPSCLSRSLVVPHADALDRIVEAATRPEPDRRTMVEFASDLQSWLSLPQPRTLPEGVATRLAAVRASMNPQFQQRDAAAIRKRDTEAAQRALVEAATALVEAVRSIDPQGAVTGLRAMLPGLRSAVESTPGMGSPSYGPAFHHGVRITRGGGYGDEIHLLISFVIQVDSEGVGVVGGCCFVGNTEALGGQHYVGFTRRSSKLGIAFEADIAATVDEALAALDGVLTAFANRGS